MVSASSAGQSWYAPCRPGVVATSQPNRSASRLAISLKKGRLCSLTRSRTGLPILANISLSGRDSS